MKPPTVRDMRRERAEGVAAFTGIMVALAVSLLAFWLPLLAFLVWAVVS